MRRRRLLEATALAPVVLAGCVSSTPEDPNPRPATVMDGDYPGFEGTVTVPADGTHWALELPRMESEDARYRYRVENLTPERGSLDVFFFDAGNYDEYVDGTDPTWYAPLTSLEVAERAEKDEQFETYGSLLGDLYLVVDDTGYGRAAPPDDDSELRAHVDVEVYPDGVGPIPEVGTIELVREDPHPDAAGSLGAVDWYLEVTLPPALRRGELKVFTCARTSDGPCEGRKTDEIIFRQSLHDTDGAERFPFLADGTRGFPGQSYRFVVEADDRPIAETVYRVPRDLTVHSPRFESFGRYADTGGRGVFDEGKTAFSFAIENTGGVPLVLETVGLDGGMELDAAAAGETGAWYRPSPDASFQYEPSPLLLPPGSTGRLGAVGYNVTRIEDVESVCSGDSRETELFVETASGFESRYRLTYALDEPATTVTLDRRDRYVCLDGSTLQFEHVESGY